MTDIIITLRDLNKVQIALRRASDALEEIRTELIKLDKQIQREYEKWKERE